jgi:hypothetical protein
MATTTFHGDITTRRQEMKVFVSIFFGAAVILTAYSNVGAWQSAIVLWKYGSRWPVAGVTLMTLFTLFAWAAGCYLIKHYIF